MHTCRASKATGSAFIQGSTGSLADVYRAASGEGHCPILSAKYASVSVRVPEPGIFSTLAKVYLEFTQNGPQKDSPGEQTVAAVRRCREGAIAQAKHPCVYPFTGTQGWIASERSNHGLRHQAAPPAFTFFPTPVGATEWSASGSRLRPHGSLVFRCVVTTGSRRKR